MTSNIYWNNKQHKILTHGFKIKPLTYRNRGKINRKRKLSHIELKKRYIPYKYGNKNAIRLGKIYWKNKTKRWKEERKKWKVVTRQ